MTEALQPNPSSVEGEIVGDEPRTLTLGELAQEYVGQIGVAFLQKTLDEGGTIEIPSLGLVIDSEGCGELLELAQSDYKIE